jgi:hypothetical protein
MTGRQIITRAALDTFGRRHYRLVLVLAYGGRVLRFVLAVVVVVVVGVLLVKGAAGALHALAGLPYDRAWDLLSAPLGALAVLFAVTALVGLIARQLTPGAAMRRRIRRRAR